MLILYHIIMYTNKHNIELTLKLSKNSKNRIRIKNHNKNTTPSIKYNYLCA